MKQLGMFSLVIMAILASFAISNAVAEVCTGSKTTFTRADGADHTQAANQDRITDNVWLTRADTQGIFNIKVEDKYDKSTHTAPADTEWALGSAADFASLTFDTWRKTFSDAVGSNMVGKAAVIHLITDDKYYDIKFLSWTASAGGGFSYERSTCSTTPPPPPPTGDPVPDIKANFLSPQINIGTADNLSVTVSLNAGGSTSPADWWVYATTPLGTFWLDSTLTWQLSATPIRTLGIPPVDFSNINVLDTTGLPTGTYVFTFSVDDNADGIKDDTFTDSVEVAVTSCK